MYLLLAHHYSTFAKNGRVKKTHTHKNREITSVTRSSQSYGETRHMDKATTAVTLLLMRRLTRPMIKQTS